MSDTADPPVRRTPAGFTVEDHGDGRLYLRDDPRTVSLDDAVGLTIVPFAASVMVEVRDRGRLVAYGVGADRDTAMRYALGAYLGDPGDPEVDR